MIVKWVGKISRLWRLTISWLTYGVAYVVPRDKRIWVYSGWHITQEKEVFTDNSKYLFLYSSLNGKGAGIRSIWLTPDSVLAQKLTLAGYTAYTTNSIKGAYFGLRAGYFVTDAYLSVTNWKYSAGSKVVQLWHGVPIKKFGNQSVYAFKDKTPSALVSPNLRSTPYITIATSERNIPIMAGGIGCSSSTVHIAGYPRTDAIQKKIPGSEVDILNIKRPETSGVSILYAPTFRSDGANPLDHLDLQNMFNFLEMHGAVLYIQLHKKFSGFKPDWKEEYARRIIFIEEGGDIYPILNMFDICITDYSGMGPDFLFTGNPLVYYLYDIDSYTQNPGLQEDALEMMPGHKVHTFHELLFALEELIKGGDLFRDARAEAFSKLFKYHDANSSQRVFDLLLKDMGHTKT